MAGGRNAGIDPKLLTDDSRRFSSSLHVRTSSSIQEVFDSSSDLFSASTVLPSRTEADLLIAHVRNIEAKQNEILTRLQDHEEQLERLGEKIKHGYDGDDESEGTHRRKRPRKKKSPLSDAKILTKTNVSDLSEEQKKTRAELKRHLAKKMKRLVGLKPNEVAPGLKETRRRRASGSTEEEGWGGEGEGVTDDDDDDDDDDSEGGTNGTNGTNGADDDDVLALPDFKKDITDETNKQLIDQAAFLIYKEQTNPETRKLTYQNVLFSSVDVDWYAKEVFRSWKTKYMKLVDSNKEKKALASLKKGMRRQRRRQKKIDRGRAIPEYIRKHGDVDVHDLLVTDWMSEYISSRSDLEGEARVEYDNEKLIKAGYTLGTKDVEIWEVVRPGFRSSEINSVYLELDEIFAKRQRRTKSKIKAVKRVSLGRMNNDIPERVPYPFMVSSNWKSIHVDGKERTNEFEVLEEDPAGFGGKSGEVRAEASDRTRH